MDQHGVPPQVDGPGWTAMDVLVLSEGLLVRVQPAGDQSRRRGAALPADKVINAPIASFRACGPRREWPPAEGPILVVVPAHAGSSGLGATKIGRPFTSENPVDSGGSARCAVDGFRR